MAKKGLKKEGGDGCEGGGLLLGNSEKVCKDQIVFLFLSLTMHETRHHPNLTSLQLKFLLHTKPQNNIF